MRYLGVFLQQPGRKAYTPHPVPLPACGERGPTGRMRASCRKATLRLRKRQLAGTKPARERAKVPEHRVKCRECRCFSARAFRRHAASRFCRARRCRPPRPTARRARAADDVPAQRLARDRPPGPADFRDRRRRHRRRLWLRAMGRPDAVHGGSVLAVRPGLGAGRPPGRPLGPARDDARVPVRHRRLVPARRHDTRCVAARRCADAHGRLRFDLPSGRHSHARAAHDAAGRGDRRQRAGRQSGHCCGRSADGIPGQVFRLADGVRGAGDRLDHLRARVLARRSAGACAAVEARAEANGPAAQRARPRGPDPDHHVNLRQPDIQFHDQRQRRAHGGSPAHGDHGSRPHRPPARPRLRGGVVLAALRRPRHRPLSR